MITLRKKADKPGVASVGVLQRKMGVTQGQTKLPPHYAYWNNLFPSLEQTFRVPEAFYGASRTDVLLQKPCTIKDFLISHPTFRSKHSLLASERMQLPGAISTVFNWKKFGWVLIRHHQTPNFKLKTDQNTCKWHNNNNRFSVKEQ